MLVCKLTAKRKKEIVGRRIEKREERRMEKGRGRRKKCSDEKMREGGYIP